MLKRSRWLLVFTCGVAAIFGIVLAGSPAQAQTTYCWTTTPGAMTPGSGTWDTATPNWSTTTTGDGMLAPWSGGSADAADFYANSSSTSTITVNGNQNVGNIAFDGSGYVLTGGTLTLGGGAVAANQDATINSVISGPNGLVKSGTGALTLGGNNTQSGGLTVNGGVLTINSVQSYAGATVINSGTLNLNSAPTALPAITGLAYQLDASNTSTLSFSGSTVTAWNDVANHVNFTTSAGINATPPSFVAGGINGNPSVSFTGTTGVGGGNNLLANQAVTAQTVFIVNQPSASLGLLGGIWGQNGNDFGIRAWSNSSWDNPSGWTGGDFTQSGGSMSINGVPLQSGNVSFAAGQPQVLEAVSASPQANFTSVLGGYFAASEYQSPQRFYDGLIGEVLVYSGTLTAAQQAAVNAYLDAKWLGIGGGNLLPASSPVSLTTSAAALNLGYGDQSLAELSGVPGSSVAIGGGVGGTLSVGSDNNSTTFAGAIGGAGGLTKVGAGVFTLSGSNTYTGNTQINGGTLQIGNGTSGEAIASPSISVSSGAALVFNHADALIYSGTIGGGGAVVKTGPGALILAGSTAQAGGLTVNGGILALNTAQNYTGATVITSGTLNVNTAVATLPVTAGLAYQLDASNPGSLSQSGGTVAAWNDVTSNHVNFTTASTAGVALPTCVSGSNGINGLPAVSFNGVNNNLLANQATTAQTVFIVDQPGASMGGLAGIWGQQGSDFGIRANGVGTAWQNGTGGVFYGPGNGDFTANGGSMSVNGGPLQTGDVSFAAGQPQVLEAVATSPYNFTNILGGYFVVSQYGYNPGQRFYNGLIGEVLVYSGTLTAAQQAAVNAYLDAKWLGYGGSNLLPTTSPVSLATSAAALNVGYGNQSLAELSGVQGSSVTVNGVLSVGGDNNSTTFAGAIGGGGELTKVGAGVFTLSGSNAYAGATQVNGGTLQIGNGTSGEAIASPSISVSSGAALVFNHADALTYSGTISGGGALVKTGPGTLTLAGSTAQTGGLSVNGGVLAVNTAQNYSGATVISSGTLTLNAAPASLPVIAGLAYHLDASNPASLSQTGGTVTAWNDLSSNPNHVNFTACTAYATLPGYVANGINGLPAVSFNSAGSSGNNLLANQAATAATVFIVNQPGASVGGLSGLWGESGKDFGIRVAGAGGAWENGSGDFYGSGDFSGVSGSMSLNGGSLQTANVAFAPGQPQVLEAVGKAAENFSDILGGYFVVSQYAYNPADTRFYTGLIGEVVVYSGALTTAQQAAVNAYLDAKWLGVGVLGGSNLLPTNSPVSLTAAGAALNLGYGNQSLAELSGVPGSSVAVGLGGALSVGSDNNSTAFAGTISGDGGLTKAGTGVFTLSGPNTYTGPTTVNGGTLQIGNGGSGEYLTSASVTMSNNAAMAFNHADPLSYGGAISGGGQLIKLGTGVLDLSGTSTYSGPTTISAGTVELDGNGENLPTATALTIAAGGVLDLAGVPQTVGSLSGSAGAVVMNSLSSSYLSTLTVAPSSGSTTFAGNIIGNDALALSGSGQLTLSGTNTYTGGTTVSGGTLDIAAPSALSGSGLVTIAAGGRLVLGSGAGIGALLAASSPASSGTVALSAAAAAPATLGGYESASGNMATLGDAPASSQGGAGSAVGGAAAAVPEPGTIALLAAGVLMLAIARRRRRR